MKIKNILGNLVIIFLSVCLAFNVMIFIANIYYMGYDYGSTDVDYLNAIDDYDYVCLVEYISENNSSDNTEITKQCTAIASYFEAASLYKVYLEAGDEEKTRKYQELMEENVVMFDDLYFIEYDILERLGLEQ